MTRLMLALVGLIALGTFANADPASTKAKIETIDKTGRQLWKLKPSDKLTASFTLTTKPSVQLVIAKSGKHKDLTVSFMGSVAVPRGDMVLVFHFPMECTDRRADGTVDSCKQLGFDGKWKNFRGKDASDRFQTFYEGMIGELEIVALQTEALERQKALDAEEEARKQALKDSI